MSRRALPLALLLVFASPLVGEDEESRSAAPAGHASAPDTATASATELEPGEPFVEPTENPAGETVAIGGFADQLKTVGIARNRGDYAAAFSLAREGLAAATAAGDRHAQAAFLYMLGRTSWSVGDLPGSIETLQQSLALADALADPDLRSAAHNALGRAYTDARELESADRHFAEALAIAEAWGDRARIAYILNGAANTRLARRDYPAARALHQRALDLREALGDRIGVADSFTNLGTIDLATGDPTAALASFRRALATYESINQPRRIASGHRRVAAALRRLGRLDEAIAELRVALKVAEPLGSPAVLSEIYRELARAHEGRGELRSALLYHRRHAAARELVLNAQARERVVELDARYQTARRENEIQRLRLEQEAQAAEISRRRQQIGFLGGGLALALGLGAVIFFIQRARLRAEQAAHLADERARTEAEQAARLKSRLLQIAAHDLKAPLSAISASAHRIEKRPEETAAIVDLARHIRTDAAHMGGLVREFLDSAAIEAGRLQLQLVPVDLAALAHDTVEDYRPLAESKQQLIVFTAPPADSPALPPALADAARLRQILDNLIANALKFTPAGGRVDLALGQTGRWVFAEVRDSGPGLKPEDLAKMFQPFQPLSAAPTGKESSTGLGLFITRELVSMHDGMLEVESQPGQGATFRVLLPAAGAA